MSAIEQRNTSSCREPVGYSVHHPTNAQMRENVSHIFIKSGSTLVLVTA